MFEIDQKLGFQSLSNLPKLLPAVCDILPTVNTTATLLLIINGNLKRSATNKIAPTKLVVELSVKFTTSKSSCKDLDKISCKIIKSRYFHTFRRQAWINFSTAVQDKAWFSPYYSVAPWGSWEKSELNQRQRRLGEKLQTSAKALGMSCDEVVCVSGQKGQQQHICCMVL